MTVFFRNFKKGGEKMTKTVLGIFTERDDAGEAINKLKAEGYNPKDISIVMKDQKEGERLADDTGSDVVGGTMSGATTGAVVGGIAGLLSSFVLPGLGAFFIGGPIATALGLTGAAASTVSGATTGAIAGGLLGALTSFGLSEDEARGYEERIKEGAILVAIPAKEGDERIVEQILREADADQIKSVAQQERDDRFEHRLTAAQNADRTQRSTHPTATPMYAVGAKGGRAGKNTSGKKKTSARGWHGDRKEHAIAGSGKDVPGKGE